MFAMPAYQSPQTPGTTPVGVIEPKLRKRLGRGRITIDGTLDLHGMRQDEAYRALVRFLQARSARGDRTILVITGKGLKKVNGDPTTIVERGVLRTMLPIWLSSPELLPLVAGWDQSAQSHGGEGAWYVRLRRGEAR
jgi:DNA-nicking Smr family endonuclease